MCGSIGGLHGNLLVGYLRSAHFIIVANCFQVHMYLIIEPHISVSGKREILQLVTTGSS